MTDAIEKARSTFNIIDRIKSVPLLTDKVTVYLDEDAGRELGGEEKTVKRVAGLEMPGKPIRRGVLGKILELGEANALLKARAQTDEVAAEIEANDAEVARLLDRAEELKERLAASAITFHLQALPDPIREEAEVAAREHVGAPADLEVDVPEDLAAAYNKRLSSELLCRVVVDIIDAEGVPAETLTADDAAALPKALPVSEFTRLAAKIQDLLYSNKILESAIDSPDF